MGQSGKLSILVVLLLSWTARVYAQGASDYAGITVAAFIENCLDAQYDFNTWPLAPPSEKAQRKRPLDVVPLLPETAVVGDAWDVAKTVEGPHLFEVAMYVMKDSELSFSGGCALYSSYIDYREVLDLFMDFTAPLSNNVKEISREDSVGAEMIFSNEGVRWHLSFVASSIEPTTFVIVSRRVLERFEERN